MVKLFILAIVALHIICGNAFTIQPKIVNGVQSDPKSFPFYVFLLMQNGNSASACGGTFISNKWIVTAAHCLETGLDVNVYVAVNENGQFHGTVKVPLANQFVYPEYKNDSHANDIALIELPFPIQTNKFVQPVNLPTDCGTDLDHEKVVAAGNGQRSFNYDTGMDTKLRHVYLQALQNDVCVENTNENIPPGSLICALPNKGQSIGQGDSGGPLVRQRDGALVGVTSSVLLASAHNFMYQQTVVQLQHFTKLHYYFDWIAAKTGIELPKCERPAHANIPRKPATPPRSETPSPPPSFWSILDFFNRRH